MDTYTFVWLGIGIVGCFAVAMNLHRVKPYAAFIPALVITFGISDLRRLSGNEWFLWFAGIVLVTLFVLPRMMGSKTV